LPNKAISIKNLSYSYSKKSILNDISFDINKGEIFIVIGPNGSGKTTLMKAISGLIKIKRNTVCIFDKLYEQYSRRSLAKTIAFVPQQIPSDFPFTVEELVMLGRSPHLGILGLDQKEDLEIARESMEFTGILPLAQRRIPQLSGGERQRVFISRAICQQPSIIILDEPTAALDLAHQIKIMDLMEKLKNKKEMTIIMVSHDINLASEYANSMLILANGKIISIGNPNKILNFKILEKVYGCNILIDKSPLSNVPRIIPVPGKYSNVLHESNQDDL